MEGQISQQKNVKTVLVGRFTVGISGHFSFTSSYRPHNDFMKQIASYLRLPDIENEAQRGIRAPPMVVELGVGGQVHPVYGAEALEQPCAATWWLGVESAITQVCPGQQARSRKAPWKM